MMRIAAAAGGIVLAFGVTLLGAPGARAELLDPGPFGGAVMDQESATIWLLHSSDPLLAKYDTNFNGDIDLDEAARISADSRRSRAERVAAVEWSAISYTGWTKEEIRETLPKPAAGSASAVSPGVAANSAGGATAPPDPCAPEQQLFIRRDRLDTFDYRDGHAVLGAVDRKKARGASVAFSDDAENDVEKLEIHGRVSYVVARQDPRSKCFTFGSDDPSGIPDVTRPFLFGYVLAPWIDAQGALTDPQQKSERSSLQGGFDAQASIGGGLFDLQYLSLAPYGQTDFRGEAAAYGVTGGWEPLALNAHLGGSNDRTNPFLSWFWQLRLEADWKEVRDAGVTGLREGSYGWLGGVARLNLDFFPDHGIIMPFDKTVPEWLRDSLSASLTYRYYYDTVSSDVAQMFGAAIAYNLSDDGSASLSFEYAKGTAKETMQQQDQFTIGLNYKY